MLTSEPPISGLGANSGHLELIHWLNLVFFTSWVLLILASWTNLSFTSDVLRLTLNLFASWPSINRNTLDHCFVFQRQEDCILRTRSPHRNPLDWHVLRALASLFLCCQCLFVSWCTRYPVFLIWWKFLSDQDTYNKKPLPVLENTLEVLSSLFQAKDTSC